jgi:hypothetical protein
MANFKEILGDIFIGAGTVLSLIPGVGPLIGAPIAAAGVGIRGTSSIDSVSNAASQTAAQLVNTSQTIAATTAAASGKSVINVTGILNWIQSNIVLVLGIIAGIIFLPKLLKRR